MFKYICVITRADESRVFECELSDAVQVGKLFGIAICGAVNEERIDIVDVDTLKIINSAAWDYDKECYEYTEFDEDSYIKDILKWFVEGED